ncbi:MAG TPA: GMP synthase [Phycisphaerales bacterium]|nr:GMP synthase [Phycisphaerales bacterium]
MTKSGNPFAMSILVFQHEKDEPSAVLGQFLQQRGHKLVTVPLHHPDSHVPEDLDGITGLVVMGGSMNVDEQASYPWMKPEMDMIKAAYDKGLPMVGVCLGAQLIAASLGGEVAKMESPEIGWQNVKLAFPGTTDAVLAGQAWDSMQFHLHGKEVTKLPPDGVPLAGSAACKNQAFRVGMTCYCFQYHFEWNQSQLAYYAKSHFATSNGGDSDAIIAQCDEHYHNYRRRGDRLCDMISTLLFKA